MMQLIVVFPLIDRMRQSALDDVGKALKSRVGYIIGTFEHLFSNKCYEKIKCYFNMAASVRALNYISLKILIFLLKNFLTLKKNKMSISNLIAIKNRQIMF